MKYFLIFFFIFLFGCKPYSKINNSSEKIIFSTEMNMKQFIDQLNVYADRSKYPNLTD